MVLGLVYAVSRLVRSHGCAVSIRIAAIRRAVSVKCRTSSSSRLWSRTLLSR